MADSDTKFIKSLVVLGLLVAFVLTIVFAELSAVDTLLWDARTAGLFALISVIMAVVVIMKIFDKI